MHFIKLPNNVVYTWIPRSASTSVAKALLEKYFPDNLAMPVSLPDGKTEPTWQYLLPTMAESLQGHRVVGLLRDPVERFRSACARTNKTPEQGLATYDKHFERVTDIISSQSEPVEVEWFKLPEALDEFRIVVGLTSLPVLNDTEPNSKPDLTPEQLATVRAYYAEDIKIYESPRKVWSSLTSSVPSTLTPRQFWLALYDAFGTLQSDVEELLGTNQAALIEVRMASVILRDHPLVELVRQGLGKTPAEVDGVFIAGGAL